MTLSTKFAVSGLMKDLPVVLKCIYSTVQHPAGGYRACLDALSNFSVRFILHLLVKVCGPMPR